ETQAKNLVGRQQAVALDARDLRCGERECRLRQASELARQQAMRRKRQDSISGEVSRLHRSLVGTRSEEYVAGGIGLRRRGDRQDLGGRIRQRRESAELPPVEAASRTAQA